MALILLIPGQNPLGVGIPLILTGGLGIANALLQLVRRRGREGERGTDTSRRLFWQAVILLGMVAVGVLALFGATESLYFLVIVTLGLLAQASRNAWDLLILP